MVEGWEIKRLGEVIFSLDAGVSVNSTDQIAKSGEFGILKTSCVSSGAFDVNQNKVVLKDKEQSRLKEPVTKDTIILSRMNTPLLVGANALVPSDYPNLFLPDRLWALKIKHEISARWLALFLGSSKARYKLSSLATGTSATMKNITKGDVRSIPVLLPPLPEQQRIAEILSFWDTAIDKTRQLIKAKERQNLQFSRELLIGKKRLDKFASDAPIIEHRWLPHPKDWEFLQVKDIAKEVSIKNESNQGLTVLSCSKHDGFVESLKYFKKKVFSDNTEGYKKIKQGEFGYPKNHIEEGSIGLQNIVDEGIVSPIYVVFKVNSKKVDTDFLFRMFKTSIYKHIFNVSTSSSVDRRGSLGWKDFSIIRIPLPPLEEQQEINKFLSVADKEITLLKQQCKAYETQKRGLMQKLLTGEWRVQLAEEITS